MQVNPEFKDYSEIFSLETIDDEQKVAKMVEDGKIVARGPKDELQRLQDDLRKLGYRKQR